MDVRYITLIVWLLIGLAGCQGVESIPATPDLAATLPPVMQPNTPVSTTESNTTSDRPTATDALARTTPETADPGTAALEPAGPVNYHDAALGVQFTYPADWRIETDGPTIIITADAADLDDPTLSAGNIVLVVDAVGELGPTALLEIAVDTFDLMADQAQVSAPEELTINSQSAASAIYQGDLNGQPGIALYTTVTTGQRAVIAVGLTDMTQSHRPAIDTVINSLMLAEPGHAVVPETEGVIELGLPVIGNVGGDGISAWTFANPTHTNNAASVATEITLQAEPLAPDLDLTVDILDPAGRSLMHGSVDRSSGTERIEGLRLPDAGPFTIVIRSEGGREGSYRLTVDAGRPVTDGPRPTAELPRLSASTGYSAELISDEWDDYVFVAETGQPIALFVDPVAGLDTLVELYDATGVRVGESDQAFDGESEFLQFVAETGGEYVLRVGGFLGDGGSYLIGMQTPGQSPDLLEQSGEIVPNSWADHVISATPGEAILVVAQPDEQFDVMIELYDQQGQLVAHRDDLSAGPGDPESHIFRPESGGSYTIRLRGFAGSGGMYRLTVSATSLHTLAAMPDSQSVDDS